MGLPYFIAKQMVTEYTERKKTNEQLCFRDLVHTAKKWLTEMVAQKPRSIALKPLAISGSLCKVISLASIDSYYAQQFNYPAVPFYSYHSGQLSHRKMAKLNGSRQGEILEFDRWVQQARQLGYETRT